jgi:hypothetical protein
LESFHIRGHGRRRGKKKRKKKVGEKDVVSEFLNEDTRPRNDGKNYVEKRKERDRFVVDTSLFLRSA